MKKTVIKKIVKMPALITGILRVFFVVVICLNVCATIYLIDSTAKLNQQLVTMKNTIVDTSESNTNDELIAIYKDIDEKTSNSIDRIITIVAIFAGMVTLFGVVLAFRAPHDLEKNVETVKKLAEEAQEAAIDAKYFSEIIEAFTVDINGEPSINDKLFALTQVIDKYPDKPLAYDYRSSYYLALADSSDNAQIIDKSANNSIHDCETAIKLNGDKSSLLNGIGSSYTLLKDYKKAVDYYTQALTYNDKFFSTYNNRGFTYYEMAFEEKNTIIKLDLLVKSRSDYTKAYEIRPDSESICNKLKSIQNAIESLTSATPPPENSNTPQESHP